MLELRQPIQLYVPSKDDFMSVLFVTDYRLDEHLYWTGIMQKTGEIWTLPNTDVRGIPNPTIGRIYKCEPSMDIEK